MDAKEMARKAYGKALETAKSGQLDGLAIYALHMLAFVDTEPADQLKWGQEALGVAQASSQPSAKAWEVRFALVAQDGTLKLCYLVPEVQHLGVGKIMLSALEPRLHVGGSGRCSSTVR